MKHPDEVSEPYIANRVEVLGLNRGTPKSLGSGHPPSGARRLSLGTPEERGLCQIITITEPVGRMQRSRVIFFSLPWVSPFHRYTDLESDLFSSEYTDCPKVIEKGELLYGTPNKKVRRRARDV